MKVGVIAPGFAVPQIELGLGVERLRSEGFEVIVHPQVKKRDRYYAGTDEERAAALLEFAYDPTIEVIWCARGGFGTVKLLPILEEQLRRQGRPRKKLLVGLSDVTALFDFAKNHLGWSVLHAPMPSMREFTLIGDRDWKSLIGLVQGVSLELPWSGKRPLKYIGKKPIHEIRGELVGGNLSTWVAMVGSPFFKGAQGKVLLLEDVGENLYRIDRMLEQLCQAGALQGARGIVLGDFLACDDHLTRILKKAPPKAGPARRRVLKEPRPGELKPLRPLMSPQKGLLEIFEGLASRLNLTVGYGLPVGHGPGRAPLPLGAQVILSPSGGFEVSSWDWRVDSRSGLR